MTAPELAVVVPTRDRPAALAHCLAALAAQRDVTLEVVVVDDASVDPAAVEAVVAAHLPGARIVRAAGRGPAAARNLGVARAHTPFVALTDDDCRPAPNWAATLLGRLRQDARVVAGPTMVADAHDPFARAAQTITNAVVDSSFAADRSSVGFAPTSNLAFAVEVHRALAFDETYPLAAGEDRDWCDRVVASGTHIAWEPRARVDHAPAPGWRGFWHQQRRYGRGARVYHRNRTAGRGAVPGRLHLRLLRAGLAQGPRVGALVLVAQVATAVGYAAEARDQARSRSGAPGRSA